MSVIATLIYVFCAIISSESGRILAVFPVPSISHQIVFNSLMQELAKRGHEVVVITTDPAFPKGQSPPNLTEIDVHDLSYKIWNDFLATGRCQAPIAAKHVIMFSDVLLEIFEAQLRSKEIQKLINDKERKFDLLFVEACVRPALSFAYIYNAPIIEFSSLGGTVGTFEDTGAPTNPLVYPLHLHQKIYNLSLWEKIFALYNYFAFSKAVKEHEKVENKIVRSIFGPKIPELCNLKNYVQMVFLNVNPIWDFNRPVPPNVVYLGGIHQMHATVLPKDLKTYLDSSKEGVIYMSFGTNARPSLLPPETLRIFINVFSELHYDILWKWEKDIPECSKNVKISKWLPQVSLLKHPKVKLFITQGGLQSIDEAVTADVPLIVLPLFNDQWFNAEQCANLNIGIHLDIGTITEDIFKYAIGETINNKTYRENVVKFHNLIRDQPQSPLERAVWWTEYMLRHGGATHLRTAAANMHWAEYYAFNLILIFVTVSLALFIGTVFAIYFVIKYKILKHKAKKKKIG